MIKILIGVCDIGNGHMNRQKSVIAALLKQRVEIVLAVTEISKPFFQKCFPELKMITTHIPWVVCGKDGVDHAATLDAYQKQPYDFYQGFLRFSMEVNTAFGGKPDFVISDYEPTVAQYAYSTGSRLICIEQQSKFIYLPETTIPGYSKNEEAARLNFFFPRVDFRIISSFFKLPTTPDNTVILPPIIHKNVSRAAIPRKGVVYFSPYSNDVQQYVRVLDFIGSLEDFSFTIYTKLDFPSYSCCTNMSFRPIGPAFIHDLSQAEFVISSSGHQLISEALDLNIPMFLFPLDTYEQHYNCLMVEQNRLGARCCCFSPQEFLSFYAQLSEFKTNIYQYKKQNWGGDWEELFITALKENSYL